MMRVIAAALLSLPLATPTHGQESDQDARFGSLRLCAGTVTDARIEQDEASGQMLLLLTFSPEASAKVAEMTTAAIGDVIVLRLADEIISEPRVYEPILGGEMQVWGTEIETMERLLSAVREACPAA